MEEWLPTILNMLVFSPVIVWVLYIKKKDKERLDKLNDELISLKTDYVNEKEVERIVDRLLKPFEENHSEIKQSLVDLRSLVQSLKTDLAVEKAVSQAKEKYNKE